MPTQTSESMQPLRIEGDMTIYRAAELRPVLLQALAAQPALEVDLSGVTEIDSAGLQLLLALGKAAAAARGTLRLSGHSPAVLEAMELLDLIGHFGDPVLVGATPTP